MRPAIAALLLLCAIVPLRVHAQPADTLVQHYRVFTGDGRAATIADIAAAMGQVNVLLVGETHDDPVAHGLELAFVQAAHERRGEAVALSLEMFERDVQLVVDEYLSGLIPENQFLAASRPWPNYATDYRPMVEYAKAHGLPVIAANAPRRYVNLVSRAGADTLRVLSKAARAYLAPLPTQAASAAYRQKWEQLMGGAQGAHGAGVPSGARMLEAQSLWDATMAHSIASYLRRHRKALVLHAVGGFHVESGSGIADHLKRYAPKARTITIAIRPADNFQAFDPALHTGLGDFVILTDASLPRTRRSSP